MNLQEIKNLESTNLKAVACTITLGGISVEAYINDSETVAVLRVNNHRTTIYSEISVKQFWELSECTSWEKVGAHSSDNAAIVDAAVHWVSCRIFNWVRPSRTRHGLVQTIPIIAPIQREEEIVA